eukprot:TRINITY_DN3180_c0_g3_i2.p2 TRINITY_DN3180_c0_g3~~TRINITY_DN3180_c0_g3_i2.p2  ORF type:complete len:225 (+),score=71.37 TRINITY_DN3180_c0_g3_i2:131-805(+)
MDGGSGAPSRRGTRPGYLVSSPSALDFARFVHLAAQQEAVPGAETRFTFTSTGSIIPHHRGQKKPRRKIQWDPAERDRLRALRTARHRQGCRTLPLVRPFSAVSVVSRESRPSGAGGDAEGGGGDGCLAAAEEAVEELDAVPILREFLEFNGVRAAGGFDADGWDGSGSGVARRVSPAAGGGGDADYFLDDGCSETSQTHAFPPWRWQGGSTLEYMLRGAEALR